MKEFSIIIAFLLIISLFAGCNSANTEGANDDTAEASQTQSTDSNTTTDYASNTFDISTDYCTLKYPKKWEDKTEIEINTDDGYTVEFSAKADDKAYPIFDVCFNSDSGYSIGEIVNDAESVTVSVVTHELPSSDDIDEETLSDLSAMQEDINVVIQGLENSDGFKSAD